MVRKLAGSDPIDPDEVSSKGYTDDFITSLPSVGEWVLTPGITGAASGSIANGQWTCHPAWIQAGTYDAIGAAVVTLLSGGGTVVCKAAVYADDLSQGVHNFPLLSAPIRTVTLDITSAGGSASTNHGTAFASPWVCPGGFYWMGFFYSHSTTPSTAATLGVINGVSYSMGQSANQAFTNRMRGWTRTGLSDLPTSTTTAANSSRSASSNIVALGLRRSA